MEPVDWLIVFNQSLSLDAIRQLVTRGRKAVFLSSHHLFDNEREAFASLGLSRAEFYTFSDLLSDAELEAIDNSVSASLQKVPHSEFMPRFSEAINYGKNALAFSKLKLRYTFVEIHACCGLGINARFWKERNARLHEEPLEPLSFFGRLKAKVNDLLRVIEVHLVRVNDVEYVFFGPVKRLRFVDGVTVERRALRNLFGGYARLIRERSKHGSVVPSTTIHGFTDPGLLAYRNLHVFVDGFHPPNYTRSYIDFYGDPIFVTKNMFDGQWLSRYGKKVIKLPAVILKELMDEVKPSSDIRNVITLLNHAGDWSALINRSDTDRLISAVVSLSRKHPDRNFIIRLHPTMIHQDHEGVHSIQRVKDYIQWVNQPNLSVSKVELHEDFERGDVFVSEYSQTLIDAATRGNRIVIANLTGRRSYMQCFEEIGFPNVSSQTQLEDWFAGLFKNPNPFDQQQNQAVRLYNRMLDGYLAAE